MVLRALLHAVVPARCGICGAGCAVGEPVCRGCGRALAKAATFGEHFLPGLDFAWAAFEHTATARRLVAAAKYRARPGLLDFALEELGDRVPQELLSGAAVVPVPADPWRSRRRGFDLAARIAERLANLTDSRVIDGLRRKSGPSQAGTGRRERLASKVPVWATEPLPPRVALIDDVVTTGTTLAACAAAAREAGALSVGAITLTRRKHGL